MKKQISIIASLLLVAFVSFGFILFDKNETKADDSLEQFKPVAKTELSVNSESNAKEWN